MVCYCCSWSQSRALCSRWRIVSLFSPCSQNLTQDGRARDLDFRQWLGRAQENGAFVFDLREECCLSQVSKGAAEIVVTPPPPCISYFTTRLFYPSMDRSLLHLAHNTDSQYFLLMAGRRGVSWQFKSNKWIDWTVVWRPVLSGGVFTQTENWGMVGEGMCSLQNYSPLLTPCGHIWNTTAAN